MAADERGFQKACNAVASAAAFFILKTVAATRDHGV